MRSPFGLDRDLRRAEHVAGGMERHLDAAEIDALAIADRLRGTGEILAIAQPHEVERFLRGEHRAVTGPRVVGMAVGDHAPSRPAGSDRCGTRRACSRRRRASAAGVFGAHWPQICRVIARDDAMRRMSNESRLPTGALTDVVRLLPEPFLRWFASRGWTPRAHQLELLAKARAGRSVLLIAPTGAGKTLAGFLPSLSS